MVRKILEVLLLASLVSALIVSGRIVSQSDAPLVACTFNTTTHQCVNNLCGGTCVLSSGKCLCQL